MCTFSIVVDFCFSPCTRALTFVPIVLGVLNGYICSVIDLLLSVASGIATRPLLSSVYNMLFMANEFHWISLLHSPAILSSSSEFGCIAWSVLSWSSVSSPSRHLDIEGHCIVSPLRAPQRPRERLLLALSTSLQSSFWKDPFLEDSCLDRGKLGCHLPAQTSLYCCCLGSKGSEHSPKCC